MRTASAALVTAAAAALGACSVEIGGSGETISRSYPVDEFRELELAGRYEVEVRTGEKPGVTARGPEELIERLNVEVRDGKLTIRPRKDSGWFKVGWKRDDKVAVTVTVPTLEAATLAGSGTVAIDTLRGERFHGRVAGSGDMRLGTVEVGMLKLAIAGSGELDAGSGRARSAEFDVAGSGDVRARSLAAEALKVSIAGSGGVVANATRTADVRIAGSGDVEVTGGAKCTVRKAGAGDVRCS